MRAVEWDRLDLLGDPEAADRILRQYTAFLKFDESGGPGRQAQRGAVRRLTLLFLAIVAAPLVGALVFFLAGTESEPPGRQANPPPRRSSAGIVSPTIEVSPKASRKAAPPPVRLVLTAALGDSWVEARADSPTGPLLFEGTLASGRTLRLSERRLWVRLGAASNLAFTLNGRRTDPDLLGTVDVLVTRQGIQPAY